MREEKDMKKDCSEFYDQQAVPPCEPHGKSGGHSQLHRGMKSRHIQVSTFFVPPEATFGA